jgi:probable HAF family extracellular repeat protein/VCBS repeat-containing protein
MTATQCAALPSSWNKRKVPTPRGGAWRSAVGASVSPALKGGWFACRAPRFEWRWEKLVTYSLTPLPPLGSSPTTYGSFAYGINDTGQVAGYGTVAQTGSSLPYQATTWSGGTPIGLLALPGGEGGYAFGINAAGQIVGETTYGTGPQATIWNGTTPTALSTPSGLISSQANAINNSGEVVGQAGNTDYHAIIWIGGVPTDLSALSGNAGAALAINNIGQVVGYSYPSGISGLAHATIWNGTTPTDLGTLGGSRSVAYGINDAGQVVGDSYTSANTASFAFIWNGGTMTALGLLPGASGSDAYGINNAGQVVGDSQGYFGSYNGNLATLWNGSTPIDLNTLLDSSGTGWLLQDALAINNVGQIVGLGLNSLGQQESFVLTPDPNVTPDRAHVSVAGTITADAAHGVLANDTDPVPNDTLSVSAVEAGSVGPAVQGTYGILTLNANGAVDGQAGSVGHAVQGTYGTLTLDANGSYSYSANGSRALPSDGVGLDIFTYTAQDGPGGSATSTLTFVVTDLPYLGGSSGVTLIGTNKLTVLDGGVGNDVLIAGKGGAVEIGGPGDILTGSNKADTFVFAPNFGNNTITNFNTGNDAIELLKSEFANFAVVKADAQQVGHNTVITHDAQDTITLTGVSLSSLHASDFHFV